jgi:hypothetical protein
LRVYRVKKALLPVEAGTRHNHFMGVVMEFPTLDQVAKASREDLARWYRFLLAATSEEQKILDEIAKRFKQTGGMTPELSRRIGHGGA